MRYPAFYFAVVLMFAAAFPSRAAEKPKTAKPDQAKRVWTNDDLGRLHHRGLISIVGPKASKATQEATTTHIAPAAAADHHFSIAAPVRTQDPNWYAQQAAELQALLEEKAEALRNAQRALTRAAAGVTEPGVNMLRENVGVTPEDGIAIQEAELRAIESKLDDLADLARRNSIAPAALRG